VPYAERRTSVALRPLVECVWAISGPGAAHRVLPDGCIDILVASHGNGEAQVVGTMKHAIIAPAHHGAVMGIRFRPGEAARLLPAAPRELTDLDASLARLWGDDGRSLEGALLVLLHDALRDGARAEHLLERAEHAVESALRRRLATHAEAVDVRVRAASELLATGHSVSAVAKRVELSERQLTRRFTDRVGVAPKMFARVIRMQHAASLLREGMAPSAVASLAGYADQAHFTRDSVELAGITPAALSREMSDSYKTDVALAG